MTVTQLAAVLSMTGVLAGSPLASDWPRRPAVTGYVQLFSRDSVRRPVSEDQLKADERRILIAVLIDLRERVMKDKPAWKSRLNIAILAQTDPAPYIPEGTYFVGEQPLRNEQLRPFALDSLESSIEIMKTVTASGAKVLNLSDLPPSAASNAPSIGMFVDHESFHASKESITLLFAVSRPRMSEDRRAALVTVTNAIVDPYQFIYLVDMADDGTPRIQWRAEMQPGC